ncbi:MAG: membrane protein insertion efficiency factor YidD [Candidatus Omnitrophica bacterium CG11_big_fil_rev_8_21_14_0_20_42_13]|uniref:Putative membrane protein insertion efficiency factor n=1 Tax=Candidatus Ghiorseimicrobium undicola TaxID=1974746 RepID=A0A2H0LXN8_9BACT|nr:MAG: membrane protein insertion efficiency factor YidD [Candidatus Omnitrophica bacterium CG11_big_fil_rev_8_21_14_0_20_42_13]
MERRASFSTKGELLLNQAILWAIKIYQRCFRSLLPDSCRFWPTCSCYAYESIERYGALKGGFKSLRRIVRCHPFSAGGYDPVK